MSLNRIQIRLDAVKIPIPNPTKVSVCARPKRQILALRPGEQVVPTSVIRSGVVAGFIADETGGGEPLLGEFILVCLIVLIARVTFLIVAPCVET